MIVSITRRIEFDAGHRIPYHHSKCKNMHGHRYVVLATIKGNVQEERGESSDGMVVDFGVLKDKMMEVIHEPWDHGFLVWEHDCVAIKALAVLSEYVMDHKTVVVHCVPTAENLAVLAFKELREALMGVYPEDVFGLESITLYETPNCHATVTRKEVLRCQ